MWIELKLVLKDSTLLHLIHYRFCLEPSKAKRASQKATAAPIIKKEEEEAVYKPEDFPALG